MGTGPAHPRSATPRRTSSSADAASLSGPVPVPGVDPGAPPGPDAGYALAVTHRRLPGLPQRRGRAALRGGGIRPRGPATVWVRLAVPVVPGEEPTPLQRVAAAADFGNGVSSELDFAHYLFINPDLTVHLHRPAVGEWVCLDASTAIGVPGVGVAQSALWDVQGPIGRLCRASSSSDAAE